jgi:ectoine hydroxylase-related dioxygenase (phytanoyl-CoA dioxygenase family)
VSRYEDFQRDGAVCVRGAFSPGQVSLVERGIERNLAEPSERAMVASKPDDPGRFFEDFCNWERIPEFEEFIRDSPA